MGKDLRYYQIEAIDAVKNALKRGVKNQILSMATGTGKTFTAAKTIRALKDIGITGATAWGTHTEELCSQSAKALIAELDLMPYEEMLHIVNTHGDIIELVKNASRGGFFLDPKTKLISDQIGIVKADVFVIDKPYVVCSMQTLHNRLSRFSPDYFDVFVADECFPAGTLVDGKPIEQIKIGDVVRSYNHNTNQVETRKVVTLFKNEIKSDLLKIKLSNGVEFICTDNHPIYTKEFGYVTAKFIFESICANQVHCLYLSDGKEIKKSQVYVEAIYENNICELSNLQKDVCAQGLSIKKRILLLERMHSTNILPKESNILFKMRLLWEGFHRQKSSILLSSSLLKRLQASFEEKKLESSGGNLSYLRNTRIGDRKIGISASKKWKNVCLCIQGVSKEIIQYWNKKKSSYRNERFGFTEEVVRPNDSKKPNVDAWHKRENDRKTKGANISFEGRKWGEYQASNNGSLSNRVRHGISNTNTGSERTISEPTNLLQSGFSCSRSEVSDRNRRQDSQVEEMEIFGQEENGDIKFVGVDSCEVYKRRSGGERGEGGEKDYVYNFEVEENHNYFVENTLVHNCHMYMANTFKKSLDYFTPKLRLGLSGTPYRMDGMLMSDIFDEIVYDYPIDKAMADGFLCKIDAIQIRTSIDLDAVHTMAGEFNQKELTITVNTLTRNNQIANAYLEHAPGRKFIAYCTDIEHAKDLCEAFVEKGIKCAVMVSDKEITTDRKGLLDEFENGDLMGLMNVGMLVTGNDFKDLGCTISASPTKSKVKFLQGPVGRLTRLKSDEFVSKFGQVGILLDIVDNTTKHKLINTYTLDKDLPVEKKVFISEKNRQMLLDAKFKREHTFTTQQRLEDVKVDLLQLPKITISESMRMKEPATEKQLAWLKKLEYDVENIHFTKQMATEIISMQPASDAQVWRLKNEGYDVSGGVTVAEASAAFLELAEKKRIAEMNQQVQNFNLPFNLK